MAEAAAPAVTARGLSRRFGRHWAVRGVDLAAPAGAVTGFVGPNGAGKTTTLRMILGLIRPDSGEAVIGGHVVRGGPDTIPLRVRALVERPAFYDALTAFDNLALLAGLTADVSAREVDAVLDRLGLMGDRDRRVAGFSTGMLQRLGLALCLLGRPELIVLDEPTNGLDPEYRVTVREIVGELRRSERVTVLLSSHLLWELEEMIDHLVLIRDGRVVQHGAIRDLLAGQAAARVRVRGEPREVVRAVLAERGAVEERAGELGVVMERTAVPELVRALVQRGVAVYEVREERMSLEDLYIATVPGTSSAGAGNAGGPSGASPASGAGDVVKQA